MWIDSVIGIFNPTAQKRRIRQRHKTKGLLNPTDHQARKYQAAVNSKRTSGWKTPNTNANSEIGTSISDVRNRSRALVRDNTYAASAINAYETHLPGIVPNIVASTDRRTQKFRDLWREFAESKDFDFDGNLDFYGMQALVARAVPESGECFLRKREARISQSGYCQVQLLESDFLPHQEYASRANRELSRTIQGVELDDLGARAYYHFFKEHPGSTWEEYTNLTGITYDLIRVPAGDVSHIYKIQRPGQVRGMSWLAPVMFRLLDLDNYEDAELMRVKIAACWSAFIIKPEDEDTEFDEDDDYEVRPGMVQSLSPGEDVRFGSPPSPGDNYTDHINSQLHAIATGLGISYAQLTGNLSQVNYSSGRMGHIAFLRNITNWQKNMIIPRYCEPVFKWWLNSLEQQGHRTSDIKVSWTPPPRIMIDPEKETQAQISAIRSGIKSHSQVARENGLDLKDHLSEVSRDNALLDSLGLIFDSDARKLDGKGAMHQQDKEVADENKN